MSAIDPPLSPPNLTKSARRRWPRRVGWTLLTLLVGYLLLAYVILPRLWTHYEHHRRMADAPKTTMLADGIPGDPLNVALVGTEPEVIRALAAAGWVPADPTTLRSSLRIASSVLFKKHYETAPVSKLYLFNRPQDLAFEHPEGENARRRHHVRFWRDEALGLDGHPLWLGAATFDESVGVSHFTGQITHHIDGDIDAERDRLLADLSAAGQLINICQVTGVGAAWQGRNGGGDRYFTDGELTIGQLSPGNAVRNDPPEQLASPAVVEWKNNVVRWLRSWGQ
jgi:LssY C-terminus